MPQLGYLSPKTDDSRKFKTIMFAFHSLWKCSLRSYGLCEPVQQPLAGVFFAALSFPLAPKSHYEVDTGIRSWELHILKFGTCCDIHGYHSKVRAHSHNRVSYFQDIHGLGVILSNLLFRAKFVSRQRQQEKSFSAES